MAKWFFISLLLILSCSYTGFAESNPEKQELLKQLAESKQDINRLKTLYRLVRSSFEDTREQLGYIERLLREAEQQKNNYYKCEAYLHYMILAYNRYDHKEINRWMLLLEPLARKEKLYDILFRGKQCVIDMLLITEEYELEEKEANALLKEAQEVENINGQMSAYQSLAHVYIRTYREKEAFDVLQKAIQLGPLCSNQILFDDVLRIMAIVCESLDDQSGWLKHLKMRDSLIRTLEKTSVAGAQDENLMLNAISYLRYCIKYEKWDEAARVVKVIEQNYSDQYHTAYKAHYFAARSYYYQETKELEKALAEIDKLLNLMESVSRVDYSANLSVKALILSQCGREREAIEVYKLTKTIKDSLRISTIHKQTEQLQNAYSEDLRILSKEALQQQIQWVFLIVSGILVVTLIISVIHTNKIKKKLFNAEQEMRQMMDETEQTNRIKERFLSNINQIIRGPLDNIVSDSAKLTSEEPVSETERKQLSASITKISHQLLDLINEILLFSRLEAGMMKFTLQPVEVISFVKNFITAFQLTQSGKIRWEIPGDLTYEINADEKYLKQVFDNLCDSAGRSDNEIFLQIGRKAGTGGIKITCVNPAITSDRVTQELTIRHEINRMLIAASGGTYQTEAGPKASVTTLTFNHRLSPANEQSDPSEKI